MDTTMKTEIAGLLEDLMREARLLQELSGTPGPFAWRIEKLAKALGVEILDLYFDVPNRGSDEQA